MTMKVSAFIQAQPLLSSRQQYHVGVCMRLRAGRYDPSFKRSVPQTPKPASLPEPHVQPQHNHHGNGTLDVNPSSNGIALDSNGTAPPSQPPLDNRRERPDRPEEPESEQAITPLHEEADKGIKLSQHWPALHNRLLANPRLPLQLAVELTVGFVSKTLAEVQARKQNFFQEMDHYLCNLSLELFGDAMLVWLLSPVAGLSSGLPKHFLQIGNYTALQRGAGFLYKGLQFGLVGIASSAVGQLTTRGMVKARGGDTRHLPEVLPNCLAWGGFMAVSSNTRYQVVNGLEQRALEKFLPGGLLGAGLTFALRFGNCYVGGVQWLPWARFWKVQ